MKKQTAADSPTTESAKVRRLRHLFLVKLGEMTAKLAVAFLLPALVGIYADKRLGSQYIWTITGIIAGVVCGALVMMSVVNDIDKQVGA